MGSSKYHLFHGCARVDPRLVPEKTPERNSGCFLVIQSLLQKMLGRASGLNKVYVNSYRLEKDTRLSHLPSFLPNEKMENLLVRICIVMISGNSRK